MATITEDYVSFEVAKLLKEKGFKEETYAKYAVEVCTEKWYDDYREKVLSFKIQEGKLIEPIIGKEKYELYGDMISAPTLQMAMKWLREVHNLHIQLFIGNDSSNDADGNEVETWYFWSFSINGVPTGVVIYDDLAQFDCVEYQSYEEAAEAGIKYCLENLI